MALALQPNADGSPDDHHVLHGRWHLQAPQDRLKHSTLRYGGLCLGKGVLPPHVGGNIASGHVPGNGRCTSESGPAGPRPVLPSRAKALNRCAIARGGVRGGHQYG
jgi:hypothetical protein